MGIKFTLALVALILIAGLAGVFVWLSGSRSPFQAAEADLVKVISPNGGERWGRSRVRLIKWTSPEPIMSVELVDTKDPNKRYELLNPSQTYAIGELPWIVAEHTAAKSIFDVPDGKYTVRVCTPGRKTCDESDAPFTIDTPKMVTLRWGQEPPNRAILDIPSDLNGDKRADLSVWFGELQGEYGIWLTKYFGKFDLPGWFIWPHAVDYDGDGRANRAEINTRVCGGPTYEWIIEGMDPVIWAGECPKIDFPVSADYNGDGKADIAVYRKDDGTWRIKDVGIFPWGTSLDSPLPADYTGDGKADLAVCIGPHQTQWKIKGLNNGKPIDFPCQVAVPGDYNGDKKADLAAWDWENRKWKIKDIGEFDLGPLLPRDLLCWPAEAQADYDGDGRTNIAVVCRDSDKTHIWHIYTPSLDKPVESPDALDAE